MSLSQHVRDSVPMLSKIQVGALSECSDLIDNGYREVFHLVQCDWWFCKLRHLHNGRTLILQWRPDYYTLTEGKRTLKVVS